MFTLLCNVKITRRQEMSFILDDEGNLQWSGRQVYSAVEFLLNEGHTEFHLDAGDHNEKLHLTVRKV